MFAHEHTSTLRIESLTPPEEWAEQLDEDGLVLLYHEDLDQVKPVPCKEIEMLRTAIPYMQRGWCLAQKCWSSTRSVPSSKEIDEDEVDAAAQVPMPPEVFHRLFDDKLKYTHQSDHRFVLEMHAKVFREKTKKMEVLKFTNLSSSDAQVALEALPHYPVLRRLEITRSRMNRRVVPMFFEAVSKMAIPEISLTENELSDQGALLVVRQVLQNRSIRMVDLKKNGITEEFASLLAEVLLESPDADVKIELDGDLGSGALILALTLKCCQAQVLHPVVKLLANSIQAFDVDNPSTLEDLLALRSLSLHLKSRNVRQELGALSDGLCKLRQLKSIDLDFGDNRPDDGDLRALKEKLQPGCDLGITHGARE
eukprot:symbB.v1.2.028752.t1/scaffold3072.1/size64214/3